MAVEYDISSDVAVIKETGSVSQCARVTQMYSGQITYDDEAGSKFATATINGKSQRVMLCIAVSGTVTYDDVPSLYSTVDGHRCLNIVTPTETGTPDDVPSLYETVVIDGQNVRAVRCIMINKTPVYDGVSSTCTFTGDDGKTHTAQLVNKVTGGSVQVIIKGTSPLVLPDAIANSLSYVKAFGGTTQGVPGGYTRVEYLQADGNQSIPLNITGINKRVEIDAQYTGTNTTSLRQLATYDSNYNGTFFGVYSNKWGLSTLNSIGNATVRSLVKCEFALAASGYNKATITVDSDTATYTRSNVRPDKTLTLFGVGSYKFIGKMYGCQIYDNNTNELLFDGIPAVRDSDSVAGLYDSVSGVFLENAGDEPFSVGPNVIPTPDAPVDIVSNNGVLKARHQSGLPWGYTLLEYITFEGTQYIDTGLAINNNTRALFDVKKSTSSAQSSYPWLGGVRDYINNTNTNKKTLEFSKSDSTKLYLQYSTSGEISLTVPDTTQRHTYDFDKNKLYIDENLIYTATQETFTGNAAFLIGTMYSQGSIATASMFYGDVYGFKLWQDGTNLSMNLIPAKRNSDNVVGMYDLVSGQFFTSAGTDDFIAGTAVSDPVEIYTDGTVETIEDTIGNTATAEMLLKVGDYQDIQEILSGAITRNVGVKVLDGTENFETATATNCYSLTNTLGTGNFANRTIACSHFASTPTLPSTSARQGLAFITNKGPEYTIAFGATTQFSTQALWKQWLADQYAAGTPVIVVYPLATPTTESVAGQTLQVTDGDNTLEITQASIGGLELEAEYSAVVTLTVQEVEDANLDNNVTVTIQ